MNEVICTHHQPKWHRLFIENSVLKVTKQLSVVHHLKKTLPRILWIMASKLF